MSPIRQNESDASNASVARHATIARSGAWFATQPADFQASLLAMARERRLDDRERLYSRGDIGDGLYCVVDGSLAATAAQRDGRETMLARIEVPLWFGEMSVVDDGPRSHDVWADGPATVLHVPHDALRTFLAQHPEHWRALAVLLVRRLRGAFTALDEMAAMPAVTRVARRLVDLSDACGELVHTGRRVVRVPQDRLAAMLALSRQTVNRALKQLESEGTVRLTRGGVELIDIDRLRGGRD